MRGSPLTYTDRRGLAEVAPSTFPVPQTDPYPTYSTSPTFDLGDANPEIFSSYAPVIDLGGRLAGAILLPPLAVGALTVAPLYATTAAVDFCTALGWRKIGTGLALGLSVAAKDPATGKLNATRAVLQQVKTIREIEQAAARGSQQTISGGR